MLKFSECTLVKLDKTFDLTQIEPSQALQNWLDAPTELSEVEHQILTMYRQTLNIQGYDWNEVELRQHFIGPMLVLVNFSSQKIGLFSERSFSGTVNGIEMGGEPDSIISGGFREPERPFFCFQEYKKERDPRGDPAGQALSAMLVAQEINDHKHPIYGCYVVGDIWRFMILQQREYAISKAYVATDSDIYDIFRILKALKQIILQLIEPEDA